jgi:hypothetical protein
MSSSVQRHAGERVRPRWPYVGRPQILLLIAALVTMVASFLPWLDTGLFGAASGVALSGGALADGMLTFYAGALAFPGVIWRSPRVVAAHLLVLGAAAIGVPGWRLALALQHLPGFGQAWLPGVGMLLVIASGVAAFVALALLAPALSHRATPALSATQGDR